MIGKRVEIEINYPNKEVVLKTVTILDKILARTEQEAKTFSPVSTKYLVIDNIGYIDIISPETIKQFHN